MGSCISTCRPKNSPQDQDLYDPDPENLVPVQIQDKLVIKLPTQEQAPKTTTITPISPPSPSSSLSSFSCNTTSTNASCSSSLSSTSSNASSSSLTSKDRAFSNEFLRTCLKDNPHIVRTNVPVKNVVQVLAPAKQSMTPILRATPKKRVRSSSPNLTRQKSFRKDPPPDLSSYYAPSRTSTSLRSPSPSRRFNGDKNMNPNPTKALSLARNKENLRPPSPGRVVSYKSGLRNREGLSLSKNISGSRFGEGKCIVGDDHDIPMEDIDNPLISLDCFIFL